MFMSLPFYFSPFFFCEYSKAVLMASTQGSLQNKLISQYGLFTALHTSKLLESSISVCLYHVSGVSLVCLCTFILGNCLFNVSKWGGNL